MKIDLLNTTMDIKPGSVFREFMSNQFGPDWIEYRIVHMLSRVENPWHVSQFYLHNANGPAAIKWDETPEWWFEGKKLFVRTQKEFISYIRNKAFW
jgi:hypothetical protein